MLSATVRIVIGAVPTVMLLCWYSLQVECVYFPVGFILNVSEQKEYPVVMNPERLVAILSEKQHAYFMRLT
jgi:hypothetical protein